MTLRIAGSLSRKRLRQNGADYLAVNVSQAEVAAGVPIGQALVVDPK
jgi:hypothetical protein